MIKLNLLKKLTDQYGYIQVIQAGLYTSIQDKGRFGYFSEGIPIAGCMDSLSAERANMLVGNTNEEALIEWSVLPPKLKFLAPTYIACTGVTANIFINAIKVDNTAACIYIPANATLSLKPIEHGVYGYIAIKGGIKTPKVLASRSWFSGVTSDAVFKKGIQIPYVPSHKKYQHHCKLTSILPSKVSILEVYRGPEYDLLTKQQQNKLMSQKFSVSQLRDRMGIQLSETFEEHETSILSSPILPGTIQWVPSGKLIALMRNAQTIGGYPRLLQLTEEAISTIAQLNNNVSFSFALV